MSFIVGVARLGLLVSEGDQLRVGIIERHSGSGRPAGQGNGSCRDAGGPQEPPFGSSGEGQAQVWYWPDSALGMLPAPCSGLEPGGS